MFVDTAKVLIQAGKGGDGVVSFRHEIYVDKGGPDGGDGGKGGDVIFEATKNLNTLLDFRYQPELKAQPGGSGAKANRRGKSGVDRIVKVPMGTMVLRDGNLIADLTEDGQQEIIARGGSGGFGNAHFKSSTRQAPKIAELGEPGESFEAELELKLLADVGIIGFPNAGKSTFLSVVSNARPEIADYAFTTLTPNLGVADIDSSSLLFADIPGLIEGASAGKGLGDDFLRHVERTSVLLHLIDAYTDDVAKAYQTIRLELASYQPELLKRPEVVALTKIEGLDKELVAMQVTELKKVAPKVKILPISSQAGTGLKPLLRELRKIVDAELAKKKKEQPKDEHIPTIRLSHDNSKQAWSVVKNTENGIFTVIGQKIEKFARRTNFNQFQSVNRLRDIMKKMGITHELIRRGATSESTIHIAGHTFTLVEQFEN